jgi:Flp pilus assembly pilin Flp
MPGGWMRSPKTCSRKGQGVAEYGLIIGLVTLLCIGSLGTISQIVNNALEALATAITTAASDNPSPPPRAP